MWHLRPSSDESPSPIAFAHPFVDSTPRGLGQPSLEWAPVTPLLNFALLCFLPSLLPLQFSLRHRRRRPTVTLSQFAEGELARRASRSHSQASVSRANSKPGPRAPGRNEQKKRTDDLTLPVLDALHRLSMSARVLFLKVEWTGE